jgi:hypothetical protein
MMSDDNNISVTAQRRFEFGLDDAIVVPLVAIGFAIKKLFQTLLSAVVHILDYAFPILLQLLRFPLFTLRIIGDAVVALLRGVVDYLPVSATSRDAWRELVTRRWLWLRQTISYKAFEEALHRLFEGGMAWVFRKCRTLTPTTALLVIVGAVLWLPISFGVATAIHAILIATLASACDPQREKQAAGAAGLPGRVAAGQTAPVRAGDFPVLSLSHEPSRHAEDRIPVPADGVCRREGGRRDGACSCSCRS